MKSCPSGTRAAGVVRDAGGLNSFPQRRSRRAPGGCTRAPLPQDAHRPLREVRDEPQRLPRLVDADVHLLEHGKRLDLHVPRPGAVAPHAPAVRVEGLVVLDEGLVVAAVGLPAGAGKGRAAASAGAAEGGGGAGRRADLHERNDVLAELRVVALRALELVGRGALRHRVAAGSGAGQRLRVGERGRGR